MRTYVRSVIALLLVSAAPVCAADTMYVDGANGSDAWDSRWPTGDGATTVIGGRAVAQPGSFVAWGNNEWGQCNVPVPNTGFIAGAAGLDHSLGLKEDGSIVAWGNNDWGQCNVPSPNAGFIAVAAGGYHSLGLKESGTIVPWGQCQWGQCAVPLPNTGFTAVAGGVYHSLGLKEDGSIVGWGLNADGQCDPPEPNTGFVAVAAGGYHSLGLQDDGSIIAWGLNGAGQCNVPLPNTGFIAVAAGRSHSLGLKEDGSIVVWGDNGYGQCNVPEPNSGFVAVAGGWQHSLGLKADGSIAAWGANYSGQCNVPAPNAEYTAIEKACNHSLAIKQNQPPYVPSDPFPADGASEVPLLTILSWVGGDPFPQDTVLYDVYFGTVPEPPLVSTQSATAYDPGVLLRDTQYYWMIVARDSLAQWTAGPLWDFVTTAVNIPPNTPDNPYPPDGALDVPVDVDLSWTGGDPDGDLVTYDVYLGTSVPLPLVSENQTATTYAAENLQVDTTYYWQIVARDCGGSTTGPTWAFTTREVAGNVILYVGGTEPNNYATIQAAVDAAIAGDTVFVYDESSPYYEHVVVNKAITLMGENRDTTIIDGGGTGVVVYIADASEVTVTGFTIRGNVGIQVNPPCDDPWGPCGWIGRSAGNTIASNRIISVSYSNMGIVLYGVDYEAENNVIIGNEVTADAGWVGIWLESGPHDDSGYPVPANNLLSDNTVSGYEFGVLLTGHSPGDCGYSPPPTCGDHNQVLNNVLSDNDYAVFAGGYPGWSLGTYVNTIQGNMVVECDVGLFFGYPLDFSTGRNTIADNTFLSPESWLDIYIRSDDNDIAGNQLSRMLSEFSVFNDITNNTFDDVVAFYDSYANHFIGDTFVGCSVHFSRGSGNHIYHNDFLDATVTVYQCGITWHNGYPSGGNYWNTYAGIDLYHGPSQDLPGSDCIGDMPQGDDRYPFMDLDGWLVNCPPYPPYSPVPADASFGVDVNADLGWTGGDPNPADVVSYDVYFGTDTPPSLVSEHQAATTYDPGLLQANTTYFWQVVAWDDDGLSSPGPLWAFYTYPAGDVDLDGDVDYDDYVLFVAAFGHSSGQPEYRPGADLDHDGVVTLVDYQMWRQSYGDYVGDPQAPLPVRPGDLNVDGLVNLIDINPFVLALINADSYYAEYPWGNIMNGDLNADGQVNFADISPFVALLSQ